MKNNLQEQIRWLKEEYRLEEDPLIVLARQNGQKLYHILHGARCNASAGREASPSVFPLIP